MGGGVGVGLENADANEQCWAQPLQACITKTSKLGSPIA